jgi:formylglycine-generating enzyme required for sulfatase activity/flavodoxin
MATTLGYGKPIYFAEMGDWKMKRTIELGLMLFYILLAVSACGNAETSASAAATNDAPVVGAEVNNMKIPENFVLIKGGSYQMGSPNSEAWRGADEKQHSVTVDDFLMSRYELTQAEYQALMGRNPSAVNGEKFPVENISWLEAVAYCNARSLKEGLKPAYEIIDRTVIWNRTANGYRLPTEAEWEYACRAGTVSPFNTENSISAEEANYYGHYPYEIEENYFNQGKLETKPGQYRETPVAVGTFSPNKFGLYDMHGNVSEWVWDFYGEYDPQVKNNPVGPESGAMRVYRGGGWNDFAKNIRSAYRAALAPDKASFNIGARLVLNAVPGTDKVTGSEAMIEKSSESGKVLVAYFSWGGNTKDIAEKIQKRIGADLFEIAPAKPYSRNYNTVLEEAQRDQKSQARPKLTTQVDNIDQYETILLGYPNWWVSIPMPIATFLEDYDFSGKTIIPFCSHGGGRFGQSLTAIAKIVPQAHMGEALSVHYSGGSGLDRDIIQWLGQNGLKAE